MLLLGYLTNKDIHFRNNKKYIKFINIKKLTNLYHYILF